MIYVLDGRGSTAVWNDAGKKISFEWKAGAIFAIPLNCSHQHFNGSGDKPARFVAVTNAPVIINAFGDVDFVFNTKRDFKERFDGEPEYFANKGEQKGLLARHQLRRRRDQPAALRREGARRGRRPHALQHGARAR